MKSQQKEDGEEKFYIDPSFMKYHSDSSYSLCDCLVKKLGVMSAE
jgi:hypothetical protein